MLSLGGCITITLTIYQSHTILGSKSQRGLTQLAMDVLFQHTAPYLADIETSQTVYPSICAADVAEAQILPAAHFLDSIYSDSGPSRATTPALVRESTQPSSYIPGAFPPPDDAVHPSSSASIPVYDRLYPSLATQNKTKPAFRTSCSPSKLTSRPCSRLTHLARSIAKLTSSHTQESSFLSVPTSRRYMPRVSALPQFPSVHDIPIKVDQNAEYAIVISMYEVYNDRIFDLLTASTSSKAPQKRRALLFKSTEHSPDRKVVAGLRKVVCMNLEEALLVLETGLQERRVAGTGSNAVSSRSHGFFCVEVKKRHRSNVPGPWSSSTLTIVDLAGSERARTAKTAGATLAEAGKINESLMYLGQCMQMQSDNSHATTPNLVPYRQCKLTELLFSNSFSHGYGHKPPQKAIMIVTADPLGDFNATSQILRYSALAREVTVPRIPSVTMAMELGSCATKPPSTTTSNGRSTPSAVQEELEHALAEMARLREDLEITQMLLAEETHRRQEVEASWKVAETRIDEVEAEVREEIWAEMEAKLAQEQRRWRAARDEELDRQDEHMDRKLELLTRGISIYEDGTADKENLDIRDSDEVGSEKVAELKDENAKLRDRLTLSEREKGMRSPSKKMRVLKTRKWDGSGMSLDEIP